jgi:aminomethyltransferase
LAGADALLGRTGYTGEDGFEILCNSDDAVNVWTALRQTGGTPCGLGARDVLRLEAGLPLHGHEIDEDTTPIEAGLHRFVRFDKGYVGSGVLLRQRDEGTERTLVGLQLPGRSAPRAGYTLAHEGVPAGSVTSGSYSPTLDTSIGMGYVFVRYAEPGTLLDLDIRGRTATVEVVPLPFYKRPVSPS